MKNDNCISEEEFLSTEEKFVEAQKKLKYPLLSPHLEIQETFEAAFQ